MRDIDVSRCKGDLIAGGFRPQRFEFWVRQVRRVLWPFIRPFHFYTVEIFGGAINELVKAVVSTRESLQAETDQRRGSLRQAAQSFSILGTDLTAAVHRQLALESEFATALTKLSEISSEQERNRDRRLALERELAKALTTLSEISSEQQRDRDRQLALAGELADVSSRLAPMVSRLDEIDQRTRLYLMRARHGLFLLQRGELISDTVAKMGEWDAHVSSLFDQISARGGVAVDIGAHFGLLTVPMARHFARVISVEPNEFSFAILTANVALNGLDNVQCIRRAMFSEEATLYLAPDEAQEVAIPRDSSGEPAWPECSNLGALVFSRSANGANPVRGQPLDSLGIDDLAFLKIDAQGADGEVIAGAMNTITRCRPVVVFEWEAELSKNFCVSFDQASRLLADAGYTLTVLRRHNEKQTDYLARCA